MPSCGTYHPYLRKVNFWAILYDHQELHQRYIQEYLQNEVTDHWRQYLKLKVSLHLEQTMLHVHRIRSFREEEGLDLRLHEVEVSPH